MSTSSVQKTNWNVFLPGQAYQVLLEKVKAPIFLVLIGLALLSSLTFSVYVLTKGWPKIKNLIPTIRQTILETYPDEMVVTVKNGEVSTNMKEPVYIEVPATLKSFLKPEKKGEIEQFNLQNHHLAVIDTQADVTDFGQYRTLVLISKDFVVYYKNNEGEKTFESIPSDMNFVLNEQEIRNGLDKILVEIPIEPIARIILIMTPLLITVFGISGTLFVVFFTTLYMWILMKSLSLHYRIEKLFVFTFCTAAIWIAVFRVSTNFTPTEINSWTRSLIHMITLGFGYAGLLIAAKKAKSEKPLSDQLLSVVFYPFFAAQELVGSKRDGGKKLVLGILLILFIVLPWIQFIYDVVKLGIGLV